MHGAFQAAGLLLASLKVQRLDCLPIIELRSNRNMWSHSLALVYEPARTALRECLPRWSILFIYFFLFFILRGGSASQRERRRINKFTAGRWTEHRVAPLRHRSYSRERAAAQRRRVWEAVLFFRGMAQPDYYMQPLLCANAVKSQLRRSSAWKTPIKMLIMCGASACATKAQG